MSKKNNNTKTNFTNLSEQAKEFIETSVADSIIDEQIKEMEAMLKPSFGKKVKGVLTGMAVSGAFIGLLSAGISAIFGVSFLITFLILFALNTTLVIFNHFRSKKIIESTLETLKANVAETKEAVVETVKEAVEPITESTMRDGQQAANV